MGALLVYSWHYGTHTRTHKEGPRTKDWRRSQPGLVQAGHVWFHARRLDLDHCFLHQPGNLAHSIPAVVEHPRRIWNSFHRLLDDDALALVTNYRRVILNMGITLCTTLCSRAALPVSR